VDAAAAGALPRRPQPAEGASYHGATTEADFRIDWSMDPAVITRWVAATPGQCFAEARGQKVFLADAACASAAPGSTPGSLVRLKDDSCVVAAAKGAVEIRRARVGDGALGSAAEVFRSLGLAEGEALGGS